MEASMQVTQAANGEKAFFRTNNGGYGTNWEAGQTNDPNEVPQYRELVSILIFQILPSTFCILVKCETVFDVSRDSETWR